MNSYREKDVEDDVVYENNCIQVVPTIFEERQKLKQLRTTLTLAYDIYQRLIKEYFIPKYNNDKEKICENLEKEIDVIVLNFLHQKNTVTSSTSLLFEEKPPRRDVLVKLGKIAHEFMLQSTYPEIRPTALSNIINKAMGSRDKRTKEKYKRCILQYTNHFMQLNILDVSCFVNLIPEKFLTSEYSNDEVHVD